MTTNIERFNILVGAIFAKLYEEFPLPVALSSATFATQLVDAKALHDGQHKGREIRIFTATVIWLEEEGYVRKGSMLSNGTILRCTLTANALELLNAMPSNLEVKGPSLGDQLIVATKEGVTEKVKDLASEFFSKAVSFGTKVAIDLTQS